MSQVMHRIAQTRSALEGALAERDWQAISELDVACRDCVDDVLSETGLDEASLRVNLEGLLEVYRQLLEVTTAERQAIVEEMSQIQRAKSAAKVYHLFG
ncbi:MAG: flagellar protein FliT [Pseudomonas sp.]|uniref:flagellar protein FliT n=1 Tax=Pseudomonas sp. TaxID=306 RepID=UPI003D6F69A1